MHSLLLRHHALTMVMMKLFLLQIPGDFLIFRFFIGLDVG
jgi:hypothetical protein